VVPFGCFVRFNRAVEWVAVRRWECREDSAGREGRLSPMAETHERWIKKLRQTWPTGVTAGLFVIPPDAARYSPEPWPESERDDYVKQCLHCANYVPLSGQLGSDWGACQSENSQYDGSLVFEHWTCMQWEQELLPRPQKAE
jgi:hypothetical protein